MRYSNKLDSDLFLPFSFTERDNEIKQLLKSQKCFQEDFDAMTKQVKELQVGEMKCLIFGSQALNSFLASHNFCQLLIIFVNSLDPDQVLNWIQTILHSDSVPERIFEKVHHFQTIWFQN